MLRLAVVALHFANHCWSPWAFRVSNKDAASSMSSDEPTGGRDPKCTSSDNPGCNNLAGLCCPHQSGNMLACCHTTSDNGNQSQPVQPTTRSKLETLTFYAYRAVKGEWDATRHIIPRSANLASSAGVLRYVHDEVVGRKVAAHAKPPHCERKNGIDRIIRFKVTMRNPQEVNDVKGGQFAPFVALDDEKCTVPNCNNMWEKYGYAVGCQNGDRTYPGAIWYSFPGSCPSMTSSELKKDKWAAATCIWNEPGGKCKWFSKWSKTCTYKYKRDGYVTLDELAGIEKGYKDFCMNGGVEFNGPRSSDDGVTIDFWKDYRNPERNQNRTKHLLEVFKQKYGEEELGEPRCDSFR